MALICPKCGFDNINQTFYCSKCGAKIREFSKESGVHEELLPHSLIQRIGIWLENAHEIIAPYLMVLGILLILGGFYFGVSIIPIMLGLVCISIGIFGILGPILLFPFP